MPSPRLLITCAGVFAVSLLAPTSLRAQSTPDCKDPQTQAEMNICAGAAYKAADAELNAAYAKAIAQMKEMDADLPPELKGAEKTLREAQRVWIPYRDKACEAYGFLARGGTMESMLVGNCLTEVTLARIKELKAIAQGLGN